MTPKTPLVSLGLTAASGYCEKPLRVKGLRRSHCGNTRARCRPVPPVAKAAPAGAGSSTRPMRAISFSRPDAGMPLDPACFNPCCRTLAGPAFRQGHRADRCARSLSKKNALSRPINTAASINRSTV